MARIIAPNKDAAHPFDIEHGTDTGGYLSPLEIVTGHVHDALGYGYSAIAPSVFREMIRRWRDTLPEPVRGPAAYSFVDVGAGKGRALLLASELPFRAIIGVELSAELARIAQRNVEHWRRAMPTGGRPGAKMHVLTQDALRFCWPRTSLLVYLYNPFSCELIEALLQRLEAAARRGSPGCAGLTTSVSPGCAGPGTSGPASSGTNSSARPSERIDVLYANPTCADVFSRRGNWVLLWTDRIDMDAGDQAADPYGTSFDRVSCYRLRP